MKHICKFLSQSKYNFRKPEIFINLTYKCPLRCEYCYVNHTRQDEFSLGELKQLFENGILKNDNIKLVTFFGGEPGLKIDLIKDIMDLYNEEFVKKGIHIAIITSMSVNSDKILKLLAEYPLFEVVVSFDYFQEQRILNNKPFKVIDEINIYNLTETQKRNMCFHAVLNSELSITDLLLLETYFNTKGIMYSYCWNKTPSTYFDISEYKKFILKVVENDEYYPKQLLKEFEAYFTRSNIGCGIGSELFISQNETISPCSIAHNKVTDFIIMDKGEIKEDSFENIEELTKTNFLNEKCEKCNIKGFCNGGCLLERKFNRDDFNSPNQILCSLQHDLYNIFEEIISSMAPQQIERIKSKIDQHWLGNIDYCHNNHINIDMYDLFNIGKRNVDLSTR